jgi:predicted nucleotidyltransferase
MNSTEGGSWARNLAEEELCEDPDIEFVVAFGSQVQGTATPESDIDIAVKFSDDLSASDRFRKRCFLAGELQDASLPQVDLVDVESLPIAVAHDVVGGEFLCGDQRRFERFRSTVEQQFESERDQLRQRQRETIARIAEEGLRG